MNRMHFQHSEAFLQWIWENVHFDFSNLQTECGKKLKIISTGTLNHTDGPDFKQAEIEIDGMHWHGDIEIHTKSRFWYSHQHQLNANFNSVILHVVAENAPVSVQCENKSSPFTLNLLPYLSKKLYSFLQNFDRPRELPCASGLNSISANVFRQQIEKAHQEYFEKKSSDILSFYQAGSVLSEAWKKTLITAVWDGLGIPQNREAMQIVAREVFKKDVKTKDELLKLALEIAGINKKGMAADGSTHGNSKRQNAENDHDNAKNSGDDNKHIPWNLKAIRPNNRPQIRIPQAVGLSWEILHQPFQDLLTPDALLLWEEWLRKSHIKYSDHFKILYGTVYLPSLYVLGKLLAHTSLSESAFQNWQALKTPIPSGLLSQFDSLNIPAHTYRNKLGAVHQLNSYCHAGKCSECLVLKKAILS